MFQLVLFGFQSRRIHVRLQLVQIEDCSFFCSACGLDPASSLIWILCAITIHVNGYACGMFVVCMRFVHCMTLVLTREINIKCRGAFECIREFSCNCIGARSQNTCICTQHTLITWICTSLHLDSVRWGCNKIRIYKISNVIPTRLKFNWNFNPPNVDVSAHCTIAICLYLWLSCPFIFDISILFISQSASLALASLFSTFSASLLSSQSHVCGWISIHAWDTNRKGSHLRQGGGRAAENGDSDGISTMNSALRPSNLDFIWAVSSFVI